MERNVRNKHKFFETEVTESTLKKVNIERILADIAESEKLLTTACTFDNIQILTAQYQKVIKGGITFTKAVEYYSALGDSKFDVYLKKMKELMKRPDIQIDVVSKSEVNKETATNK